MIVESVLTPFPGDTIQAIGEMVRVVKSGGLIAANEGTINPERTPELYDLLAVHPAIHGTFTPEALQRLFEESGLQVIETRIAGICHS